MIEINSPMILLRYLLSELGKQMVENLKTGSAVSMIKIKDLQNLVIPVPTMEQQKQIEQNYQHIIGLTEQIKDIEDQIEQAMKEHWAI